MRSLLRIAVAAATLLVLGVAAGPGAAYAVDGDEHVARMRLRVVDAVNEETRVEIERARAGLASSGELARLEEKFREGKRLAADLRAVRAVPPRGGAGSESAGHSAGDSHSAEAGNSVFRAARTALPHTPAGVLSLVGGGALALVGGGVAAAVVRRPREKA
uniref:Secreted protein n=1 Tax=Streptomyces sp. NBC_00003 TaxID=2903608 RepID=A0AAU2V4D9_9ACTN